MKVISTKEEREQLIESLVNEETNILPLDKKDCNYLKNAQTIIEYTFRTNFMEEGNRVAELLKIFSETDLSAIKGFHHLCFIMRSSSTYEISMDELCDILRVLTKGYDSEASILWTVSYENSLGCNLELVMIASK